MKIWENGLGVVDIDDKWKKIFYNVFVGHVQRTPEVAPFTKMENRIIWGTWKRKRQAEDYLNKRSEEWLQVLRFAWAYENRWEWMKE